MMKRVLILGGQHGDELSGMRICRMLLPMRSPERIIIPCLNIDGLREKTREFKGIDLNRSYHQILEDQEAAELINLVKNVCINSSLVIDVHSTFDHMLDEPCFITNDHASHLNACFTIDQHQGDAPEGSLRWFCNQNQIPMITYEAVEYDPFDQEQINLGVDEILNVLSESGFN